MPDPLELGSNRGRSLAFRNEVLLYLHAVGLREADRPRARPRVRLLSEAVRNSVGHDGIVGHGDIVGLPWTIAVRNQHTIDLSGSLDEAAREARYEGKELFASIQRRRSHPISESYVTMPLSVFVQVLRLP